MPAVTPRFSSQLAPRPPSAQAWAASAIFILPSQSYRSGGAGEGLAVPGMPSGTWASTGPECWLAGQLKGPGVKSGLRAVRGREGSAEMTSKHDSNNGER